MQSPFKDMWTFFHMGLFILDLALDDLRMRSLLPGSNYLLFEKEVTSMSGFCDMVWSQESWCHLGDIYDSLFPKCSYPQLLWSPLPLFSCLFFSPLSSLLFIFLSSLPLPPLCYSLFPSLLFISLPLSFSLPLSLPLPSSRLPSPPFLPSTCLFYPLPFLIFTLFLCPLLWHWCCVELYCLLLPLWQRPLLRT